MHNARVGVHVQCMRGVCTCNARMGGAHAMCVWGCTCNVCGGACAMHVWAGACAIAYVEGCHSN